MIGKIIGGIAALGLCACLLIGAFWAGERDGWSQAALKCTNASQAAELKAEHIRYVNLEAQLKAQQAVIALSESAKRRVQDLLAKAKARVVTVKVAKDCTVGQDAIDAMNSVRKAGAP